MNTVPKALLTVGSAWVAAVAAAQTVTNSVGFSFTTNSVAWTTNGPAVFAVSAYTISNTLINPRVFELKIPLPPRLQPRHETNTAFDHFVPGSFADQVWTNVTALTNHRAMEIWTARLHSENWPTNPPLIAWNTNSLMWGFRGLTALSPCWTGEGSPGQVPITALTRRHGYTRGHGMGNDGFGTARAGQKVWFAAADNTVVEVKILRDVVRTTSADYTIVLFDRDLPQSIQPLRVVSYTNLMRLYPHVSGAPHPLLCTEQHGRVSASMPGFSLDIMKPGDSGSPNLLPWHGELIFLGGRTTAPASPGMQEDMDELCRLEGLNPRRYQLQWAALPAQ